ncbi:MAG: RNA-directed DNA polymerase, partial [Alphaproteobacteria bacterium]|nr:RNA-directed DNA polymerase [Alphaproteobacteria bacterium]
MKKDDPAKALAAALLAGEWSRSALEKRAITALGARSKRRASRIVDDIWTNHKAPYVPHRNELRRLIYASNAFAGLGETAITRLNELKPKEQPPRFAPLPRFQNANLPPLATAGDLAQWLGLSPSQLDWFADERRTLARASDTLQHYSQTWLPKRSSGWRLIEAPKPRLKDIQRRILRGILDPIPTHDAAFGFVPGRSCTTAAAKHAGEGVVVTLDLRDFFVSVPAHRVHALFRCLGYLWSVARLLTGLCTAATPHATLASDQLDHETRQRLRARHLPQGAPTSPTLANFAARRLDARLDGLARRFEARYTRYADDLTFSGDERFHTSVPRFLIAVAQIARDEGFALNAAKTRIMPRHTRQTVTGIVVNDHINVARP